MPDDINIRRLQSWSNPWDDLSNPSAKLQVSIFDGTRNLIDPSVKLLVDIRDGFQNPMHHAYHKGPIINFIVPLFNGLGDNYTVIVKAENYKPAGFTPVKVSKSIQQKVDLMLLPKRGQFRFLNENLASLKQNQPELYNLLVKGAKNDQEAEAQYADLMQKHPASLAAILNITTAMANIELPEGTILNYFKKVLLDSMISQNSFIAYADNALIDQIKLAATQGKFVPSAGALFFHPEATLSYKQMQFGEANLQLTFYESDTCDIESIECIKVAVDIDYYKNLAAHALVQIETEREARGLVDAQATYVLLWLAGQRAEVPKFNPPYIIEAMDLP